MISISPVGVDTHISNMFNCMVTISETLPYFCPSSSEDKIEYITGIPMLDNETVFVPVTAIVTLLTSDKSEARFTESFVVAFQEQNKIPSRIRITSVGQMSLMTTDHHNKEYKLYDSIEIIIA